MNLAIEEREELAQRDRLEMTLTALMRFLRTAAEQPGRRNVEAERLYEASKSLVEKGGCSPGALRRAYIGDCLELLRHIEQRGGSLEDGIRAMQGLMR